MRPIITLLTGFCLLADLNHVASGGEDVVDCI